MTGETENLHLVLPDLEDARDITVINGNMEIIDGAIHDLQNVGSSNQGKFMVVDANGDVKPTTVPFANGGTY